MASKRTARLNEQLKRELAGLIRTELRDPRIGLVSVTGVEAAPDLGSAKVFVRPLGDDEQRAQSLEGLTAAAPYLRKLLGQILEIRRVPELRFHEDRTLERARRIEDILADVLPAGDQGNDRSPDAVGEGRDEDPEDSA